MHDRPTSKTPPPLAGGVARQVTTYERLKQAILGGALQPGEQLIEAVLAEWCQVSRTPIREALTRLEQDGLVRRGERGLIVRESSPQEILDLYDARIVLESRVAEVAAERRTSFDLVTMKRAADRMNRADGSDVVALAEANRAFHRTLWLASHNGALTDLLERLNLLLGRYPETTLVYPGRLSAVHSEHEELIDAIEARDGGRSSAIALQHFTEARDIRLALWGSD